MLPPELIDLIQARMASSYTEQLWAVALVGSMCCFLITQADQLLNSISYKQIKAGIWIVTALCVAFILLRHGVYFHYSRIIDKQYPSLVDLSLTMTIARWIVMLSGVILYSCITIGLAAVADKVCKQADKRRKERESTITEA